MLVSNTKSSMLITLHYSLEESMAGLLSRMVLPKLIIPVELFQISTNRLEQH